VLWTLAVVGSQGGRARIDGAREVSPWIWAFIGAGVFLVLAYNLELFGGVIHSDLCRAGLGRLAGPHGFVRANRPAGT